MASPYIIIDAALAEIAEFLRAQPTCAQTREWRASASKYRLVVDSWQTITTPTDEQVRAMEACVTQLHSEVVASGAAPTVNELVAPTDPE